MNNDREMYSRLTSSVSVNKITKKCMLNIQRAGNCEEWENANFKINALIGLRRSPRIGEQNGSELNTN